MSKPKEIHKARKIEKYNGVVIYGVKCSLIYSEWMERDMEKSYYWEKVTCLRCLESRKKEMSEFDKWLRTVCFQEPTQEAYDLAKKAWYKSKEVQLLNAGMETLRRAEK